MSNGAELLSSKPALKKAFFDLGWDYFSAKQGLPNDATEYPCFIEGYEAARGRIKSTRGDRYDLKLLQIRYGALKRNRIIDETVTVDVLRRIDVKRCPITLQPLTHSTMTDSDWSVDRVNNRSGYTLGNLVVVSIKANKAKGSLSFEDIDAIVESGESYNGLTVVEWSRWRTISSLNVSMMDNGQARFGYCCTPYVVECPQLMILNPSAALQHAIAIRAMGFRRSNFYSQLIAGLPKPIRQELNALVTEAAKYKHLIRMDECEVWFMTKLFNRFKILFATLKHEHKFLIATNLNKDVDNKGEVIQLDRPAWNPELKGYNK